MGNFGLTWLVLADLDIGLELSEESHSRHGRHELDFKYRCWISNGVSAMEGVQNSASIIDSIFLGYGHAPRFGSCSS
jgi:hypothetical protein